MASSAIVNALLTFCATINSLQPWMARLRSSANTSATTRGLCPMLGSSISSTLARSSSSARPTASCFCSPPDKGGAALCSRSLRRGKRASTSGMRDCVVFLPNVMPPSARFS